MRGFKQQEAIYERKPTYQKLHSGAGKITGQNAAPAMNGRRYTLLFCGAIIKSRFRCDRLIAFTSHLAAGHPINYRHGTSKFYPPS